jgi:CheY-like chemotaxis protein
VEPAAEQMQPPPRTASPQAGQPRGRRRAAQQTQQETEAAEAHGSVPAVRESAAREVAVQPSQLHVSTPVPPPLPEQPAAFAPPHQPTELPAASGHTVYALPGRVSAALPAGSAAEQEPEPEAEPEGPQLLLWPDPDEETNRLLRDRGYEPVALGQPNRLPTLTANGTGRPHPFAVFVDPISAPITRRGLREVRAASTKAGLPLLVTAGIGRAQDGRELGPDPSLLLTALCPAEVRLPRVLLVEARGDLADAIAELLEHQGMQVTQATTDAESREAAVAAPPDLVLLDLMQIRRRRIGVVDWLRDRGLLARTPLVVYTAQGSDADGLETLYLTERATDAEPANRIGDLLAKIAP